MDQLECSKHEFKIVIIVTPILYLIFVICGTLTMFLNPCFAFDTKNSHTINGSCKNVQETVKNLNGIFFYLHISGAILSVIFLFYNIIGNCVFHYKNTFKWNLITIQMCMFSFLYTFIVELSIFILLLLHISNPFEGDSSPGLLYIFSVISYFLAFLLSSAQLINLKKRFCHECDINSI
uniref:Transmembrane protein n=1 Tax=Strongyloides venezuelensis TaxID=75913 RepID=A0A0K0EWH8_STRVS